MVRRLIHWEYFPVLLLIAVNLVVGVVTVRQFGESWDENSLLIYAEQSLDAYKGLFEEAYEPVYDPALRFYGPAYVMLQVLIARAFPVDWLISDVGHLVNFMMFQLGLVAFYMLARRWFKPWSAFCATLLFSTQPLFWGHAFINSKDIPFMVFFLISVLMGLNMVDDFAKQEESREIATDHDLNNLIRDEWGELSERKKKWIRLFVFIGVLGLIVGLWVLFSLQPWLEITLADAVEDPQNAVLEIYLRRLVNALGWILGVVLLVVLWFTGILNYGFPHTKQEIWRVEIYPLIHVIRTQIVNPKTILAGITLGLAISIRAIGLAAALLVFIYTLWVYGKKLVYLFLPYSIVAALIVYWTWPYLWSMPIVRFVMSFKAILQFPWSGMVLFNGFYYPPDGLPWYAIPWLILIQLAEPVVIICLVGMGILFWQSIKWKRQIDLMLLVIVWFLLPLGWSMLPFSSMYDNFRQLFFIIPPLFLVSGMVFEWLVAKFRHPVFRMVIPLLLIIPGILSGMQLHPYEYIYYNRFAGGTNAAFRKYELDYWVTSYRASTDYINEFAPEKSKIYVWGPAWIAKRYAREDLNIYEIDNFDSFGESIEDGSYIILSSRYDHDLYHFPNLKTIYAVTIDNVVLSVIKTVSGDS